MRRGKARRLREVIEQASGSLPDVDALDAVELFPAWKPNTDYTKGQRVREDGLLYRLIPGTHHSQSELPPHLVPAVWARVDDPGEEWPEWRQPLSAEDAYSAGAKVSHQGKHWINTHGDGNVWEPGVYGWAEQ